MRLVFLVSLLLYFVLMVDVSVASTCRIEMKDYINLVEEGPSVSVIELKEVPSRTKNRNFIITDKVDSEDSWSERFYISKKDDLVNVPTGLGDLLTKNQILKKYKMKDDSQLVFSEISGSSCTEQDRALIYYFIMEWFYFG
ncbi:MAG: hypothetical protein KC493_01470 [Bacteriovoracaceae bacterium]|nr:hypothetical protein [Bacteriovoracaceae bacterium]